MTPLRKLTVLATAGLIAFAPAACARGGGSAGPAGPGRSAGAAVSVGPAVSPAPSPSAVGPPVASPTEVTPTMTGRVVSATVTYPWHWPNDVGSPAVVRHDYAVPPVPRLAAIGAASHPGTGGERAYDRMSFTFTTAMPGYSFAFADQLIGDGTGQPVPVKGNGVLRVMFRQAQAHNAGGTDSSILTKPSRPLHLTRMTDYAPAGDFEGVVTYGIGVGWPVHSNPQPQVRAYEVVRVLADGQMRYTVAIDIAVR
ncbi:hypothetical protein [Dactylosporangium sp. NPDC049140]|uniref:AMIN-like domain-containing (lipo)protein n=1 Tax=Dactylosporangium sp. NPDC049140 TaxID=3155647 RepID=UPI0033D270B9